MAALLVVASCSSVALAFAAGVPRVRVVRLEPKAVVRGTGFLPREHLLVRLAGLGVASKRVVAGDAGGFRVSLRTPAPRSCGRYTLTVVRPAAKPVLVRIGPPECALPGAAGG